MSECEKVYRCERCGRKSTKREFELYDGLCEDCYAIEIDELDFENGY
jgi:NMD protein affecting ribosome stability and mRNA decay